MAEEISRVITFYSYKGGVGRSMALANIGVLLSQWGYKVLVVDWDLEAPGLENYYKDLLDLDSVTKKLGLIDLLNLKINEKEITAEKVLWNEFITLININNVSNLHFLSAGKRDKNYVQKVQDFNYISFYEKFDGGEFLEQLREFWLDNYDFVLIDSRTGLTDSSGICSIHMPDILVLLFTPNEQSFYGVKDVSKKAIEGQKDIVYDRFELRTLPIPCRIENAETTLLDEWMAKISNESLVMLQWLPKEEADLQKFLVQPSELINKVKIPYKTLYAYGERLAVIERGTNDSQEIGYVYETISAILANDLQNIDLLINSRDDLIKKAKGEEITDHSSLLRKVASQDEEKMKLQEELLSKVEMEKKRLSNQKNIAKIIGIVIALTSVFFIIYKNLPSTKKQVYYNQFLIALNSLKADKDSLSILNVCRISGYANKYDDNRIKSATDSLKEICYEFNSSQKIIESNTNKILELELQITPETEKKAFQVDVLQKRIFNLESSSGGVSRTSSTKEILSLEKQINSIVESDTILRRAADPNNQIEKASIRQDSIKSSYSSIGNILESPPLFSKTAWFKEGYFLQFNNIRVTLDELDKEYNLINVTICEQDDNYPCKTTIGPKNISISLNNVFKFDYKSSHYKIILNRIGRAGKNPFNHAAYITFEKYQK